MQWNTSIHYKITYHYRIFTPLSRKQNLMQEKMTYIAHAKQNLPAHPLEDHLRKVAHLGQEFAEIFGASDWAYLAGLWHDLGKYRKAFQAYIMRGSGIDPNAHIENNNNPRTNHASSGAIHSIKKLDKERGLPLAYIIAGHHAGLPDYDSSGEAKGSSLQEILEHDKSLYEEILHEQIPEDILSHEKPTSFCPGHQDGAHLWIRMLFSCLVDADFLDTEAFMSPDKSKQRPVAISLDKLLSAFNKNMDIKMKNSENSNINEIREQLLSQCREAAKESSGIFTLTIPTGGGKTLSSLAFALEHAIRHKKRRVIYAIPYTSIIEQTAEVFAEILDPFGNLVLEHHSNIEPDKESKEDNKSRLATENWDAPIIVTTTVQLFESLFAARTSRCRKLHNLVNSVIVLDEVQLLPLEHLNPIREVIALLAKHYGVTFVLSTATPTALNTQNNPFGKKLLTGLDRTEIIRSPTKYYDSLKRVHYTLPTDFQQTRSWEEIAKELKQYSSVLVIVNKRQDAKDLFELMPDGTYHLSALMCAEHRSNVIKEIKKRIKNNKPTKVISTQLVEAGVDFDFPVVYRSMAGLDSIVQAGGRCNRENKIKGNKGKVIVFIPPSKQPPGIITMAISSCISTLSNLSKNAPIDSPQIFECYFNRLFTKINTDIAKIGELLKRDADRLQIQFRTAAQKFRMIDNTNMHTVYVRYGKDTDSWLERLRYHPNRDLLKKLQRYTVTIYAHHFKEMCAKGDIEEIYSGFYAQTDHGDYNNKIYDNNIGLVVGDVKINASDLVH